MEWWLVTFDPVVDLLAVYGEQVAAVPLAHTARLCPIPNKDALHAKLQ